MQETTPRIVATFIPQYNIDNETVGYVEPVPEFNTWDVTEAIINMRLLDIQALRDDRDESDDLTELQHTPECAKEHTGPFVVRVRQSVEDYFKAQTGKDLDDVTQEDLQRIRDNFEQIAEVIAIYEETGNVGLDVIVDLENRERGGIQTRYSKLSENPHLQTGTYVTIKGGQRLASYNDILVQGAVITRIEDEAEIARIHPFFSLDHFFKDIDFSIFYGDKDDE